MNLRAGGISPEFKQIQGDRWQGHVLDTGNPVPYIVKHLRKQTLRDDAAPLEGVVMYVYLSMSPKFGVPFYGH